MTEQNRIEYFRKMPDTEVLNYVRYALRNKKVDVFVQPIVSLPQRKISMYEVFARIVTQPGHYIPAARYLPLAEKENITREIDNLLLMQCLEMLRDRRALGPKLPYVLNVSAETLRDKAFMGNLLSFLSEERKMAQRLIFELPQEELENMSGKMIVLLEGLSQIGCRFSMDRVTSGRISIDLLKKLHISFLKLDSSWLIRESRTAKGFDYINRMKKALDEAGINMIVERVETESGVRELLDFSVDYGQGYLFGKPDIYATYRDRINSEYAETA